MSLAPSYQTALETACRAAADSKDGVITLDAQVTITYTASGFVQVELRDEQKRNSDAWLEACKALSATHSVMFDLPIFSPTTIGFHARAN
jgi:hypothetical protein